MLKKSKINYIIWAKYRNVWQKMMYTTPWKWTAFNWYNKKNPADNISTMVDYNHYHNHHFRAPLEIVFLAYWLLVLFLEPVALPGLLLIQTDSYIFFFLAQSNAQICLDKIFIFNHNLDCLNQNPCSLILLVVSDFVCG